MASCAALSLGSVRDVVLQASSNPERPLVLEPSPPSCTFASMARRAGRYRLTGVLLPAVAA